MIKYILNWFKQDKKGFIKELQNDINESTIFSFKNSEQINKQLSNIQNKHELLYKTAQKLYKQHTKTLFENFVAKSIAENKLTDDDFGRIELLSKLFGVDNFNVLAQHLQPYRDMVKPMVPVPCNLLLQKSEKCYLFVDNVRLNELRRKLERISYAGPRVRIKIIKGFSYTLGSSHVSLKSSEEMTEIDRGNLYFTCSRIIFVGGRGNKIYKPSQILDYKIYKDGLSLDKATGKNPFFSFVNTDLRTNLLIERIFREVYFCAE